MCDRRNIGIVFDGSFEGFLCIIHDFYYKKIIPAEIVCEKGFQQSLGINYQNTFTDYENALVVSEGIRKKISQDCFNTLYCGFSNKDENRFMDLFNYAIAGFKIGKDIDRYEQWDFVLQAHKHARNTLNEAHFFKEFIRFRETKDGVLYSRIDPENNVLPFIADHFASRLIDEKWIIHDANKGMAVVYDSKEWAVYDTPANATVEISGDEENFQNLWIAFFNAISIKERESNKRQRNMLPLRYRKNMLEFKR